MRESKSDQATFAVAGLGYIFDKHKAAIEHVIGGEIVAICDKDESKFIKQTDAECFVNFDDMLNLVNTLEVDYVVICTPNYLHVPMIVKTLYKTKAQIICEKPIWIDDWFFEKKIINNPRVNCMLQLQYLDLPEFKDKSVGSMDIYINRGDWYFSGWKGKKSMSGGLKKNIGVHYFDIVQRIYGEEAEISTFYESASEAYGLMEFTEGKVSWSIDLTAPEDRQRRIIKIGDQELNLTNGIEVLHNIAYKEILKGNGIKVKDIYHI